MATLKPQPRTRQRALLREWGVDERYVPEGGIDNHGIWVLGEYRPDGFEAIAGEARLGDLPRTQYGYRSRDEQMAMLKAQEDDWDEYKRVALASRG